MDVPRSHFISVPPILAVASDEMKAYELEVVAQHKETIRMKAHYLTITRVRPGFCRRVVPRIVAGDAISALAVTEPGDRGR